MPKVEVKSQEARVKKSGKKHAAPGKKIMIKRGTQGTRVLPLPKRIWYKPQTWSHHVPAPPRTPLPKARQLVVHAARHLWRYRLLFGGISLIYGILNLLLVRGLAATSDVGSFKEVVSSVFRGAFGKVETAVTSFLYLVGTSGGGGTPTSGTYQTILLILVSLAFIWALRQTTAGHRPRLRDSFYLGMYPLVPFLLVLLAIGVQLVPLAIGAYVYGAVVAGGIATDAGEQLLIGLLCAVPAWWSLRMVTSSAFALYIVTLPDMTPMKALRSARELVRKRRLLVWRKFILLPVVLLLAAIIIEVPLIFWLTPLAEWAFFVYSMLAPAFVHGYMYSLYREML
jgi:hypothetical protein